MALTHNQSLVLTTLQEHKNRGGRGIANGEIDTETNRWHNRHFGYDQLHSILKRLEARGLVKRDKSRPARWSITAKGSNELYVQTGP